MNALQSTEQSASTAGLLRPSKYTGKDHPYLVELARVTKPLHMAVIRRLVPDESIRGQLISAIEDADRDDYVELCACFELQDAIVRGLGIMRGDGGGIGAVQNLLIASLLPVALRNGHAVHEWPIMVNSNGRLEFPGSRYFVHLNDYVSTHPSSMPTYLSVDDDHSFVRITDDRGMDLSLPLESFSQSDAPILKVMLWDSGSSQTKASLQAHNWLNGVIDVRSPLSEPPSDHSISPMSSNGMVGELLDITKAAIQLIEDVYPAMTHDIFTFTRFIQPYTTPTPLPKGMYRNIVHRNFPGVSFLSTDYYSNDHAVVKVAEVLIHLAAHTKEAYLGKTVTTIQGDGWYYAPWRSQFRPAGALLSGVIAFTHVLAFHIGLANWRDRSRVAPGWDDSFYLREISILVRDLRQAIASLGYHTQKFAQRSPAAREITSVLEDWIDDLSNEASRLGCDGVDRQELSVSDVAAFGYF